MKKIAFAFIFSFCLILLPAQQAHAYLDPGSGSYILQIILAGLLTVSLAFKTFWKAVFAWFKSIFSKPQDNKED